MQLNNKDISLGLYPFLQGGESNLKNNLLSILKENLQETVGIDKIDYYKQYFEYILQSYILVHNIYTDDVTVECFDKTVITRHLVPIFNFDEELERAKEYAKSINVELTYTSYTFESGTLTLNF